MTTRSGYESFPGAETFRNQPRATGVLEARERERERESVEAPPDMKTGRSLPTCPSRALTTRHEGRSKRKTGANVKALKEGLTQKKDEISQNPQPWVAPTRKQEKPVISTREGKQLVKVTREAHVTTCETRST